MLLDPHHGEERDERRSDKRKAPVSHLFNIARQVINTRGSFDRRAIEFDRPRCCAATPAEVERFLRTLTARDDRPSRKR